MQALLQEERGYGTGCGGQPFTEQLFSTVVGLMALVAMGMRPSVHVAAKSCPELKASMTALYDKVMSRRRLEARERSRRDAARTQRARSPS